MQLNKTTPFGQKLIVVLLLCFAASALYAQGSQGIPQQDFGNSILGAAGSEAGTINAVLAFEKMQEAADAEYKAERFEEAFKYYHELAKFNDKFSQYRVGFMYANGRGVEKDMAKAYAWTYVASETRQKGFVNYHVQLRDGLTDSELARGKELAEEYFGDYGTFAVANQAKRLIRKQKRECTGSRVGSSCDRASATGFNCGLTSQGVIGRECMTLGAIGLPSVVGLQPTDLRNAEKQLNVLIDTYNPGRVELGELELIED